MIISSNPDVPNNSLIGWFHRSTHSIRAISAVVITCISWLSVYPLAAAAEEAAKKPPASAQPAKAEEDKHGKTIEKIEANLKVLDAKLKAKKGWDTEKQALKTLKDSLEDLDRVALSEFDRDLDHINKHKLSDVIRQRHSEAVAKFKEESGKLKSDLATITTGQDGAQIAAAVKQSLERIKAQTKKRHVPFDPKNLPFRTPDSKVRPPKLTKKEFADLFPNEQVLFADNGSEAQTIAIAQAMNLPSSADLAPTEDVQITDAIRAKAAELNHNPVEIYNWVHNNVEFIPTYGSIQGSDYTLQNLRGNAFDTSSLLIALLRASNIPARYVYGTVQIPTAQVMNWVGGVEVPQAAQELLGQGGIPNRIISSGGKATAFQLEHIWVEAWVDFHPSRGAKNIQGDSWVPMDGSFKQYQYTAGMNLAANVPFDADGFAEHQANSIVEEEAYVQNVDYQFVEGRVDDYLQDAKAYVASQNPNATVQDIIGAKVIRGETPPGLASALPHKVVAYGTRFTSISTTQRRHFRFHLFNNSEDRALDLAAFTFDESLPTLVGKRFTLSFEPATDRDRETIESFLPTPGEDGRIVASQLPRSLPGYLINLKAQLKLKGTVLYESAPFVMGSELASRSEIQSVHGDYLSANNQHVVGEFVAITMQQSVGIAGLRDKQQRLKDIQTQINARQFGDVSKDALVGEILHSTVSGYFVAAHQQTRIHSQVGDSVVYGQTGFGAVSTNLLPVLRWGVPKDVQFKGVIVDIDLITHSIQDKSGSRASTIQETQELGYRLSSFEHLIPGMLFNTSEEPGAVASAAQALAIANREGQRVYFVDGSNEGVLNQLSIPEMVKEDIRTGVRVGFTATVHERGVNIGGLSTVGYTIIDPDTGTGAYRVATGDNGGIFVLIGFGLIGLTAIMAVLTFSGGIIALLLLAATLLSLYFAALEFGTLVMDAADSNCSNEQKARAVDAAVFTIVVTSLLSGIGSAALKQKLVRFPARSVDTLISIMQATFGAFLSDTIEAFRDNFSAISEDC